MRSVMLQIHEYDDEKKLNVHAEIWKSLNNCNSS